MELKTYQKNCLDVLNSYFQLCRITGHEEAYRKITADPDIAARLGKLKSYTVWDAIPDTPRVCIKVPTGGGKTILAAHAVKIIGDAWCEKDFPLVLWFVPSDTIRRQTAEALKNPRHPYRMVLDQQFDGKVQIFDLDEKFSIRPSDIEENACIVVSTIQSFVKKDTSKYNVYRDNENLEPHFAKFPAARFKGMEYRDENDRPKYSFANLLYCHRPIMIVDEAHKAVTELTRETQQRINPSAMLELTATPVAKDGEKINNVLYSVRASELKEEEMIKLPIALVEEQDWKVAVESAILRRAELEKLCEAEDDYVRPILLFQAQSREKEVNVEALKNYLVETANLNPDEIKIATGEQKELDGIDVFSPDEPARFIITVEALKEGWDCSFAYILCSLANVKSDTSVEQLLGRVMRMPYAKTRKTPGLNRAYAFVLSPKFGDSAAALTEKLKNKGFDDEEALASIQRLPGKTLFGNAAPDKFDFDTPVDKSILPPTIKLENEKTIVFTPATTEDDMELLCAKIEPVAAAEIKWKYAAYKRCDNAPSPAAKGEKFTVPRLLFEASQGEFLFAESDTIFSAFNWNIADYCPPKLDAAEFNIEEIPGRGYFIDLDGERLRYSDAGKDQLGLPLVEVEQWTAASLAWWLDRALRQDDIPQSLMLEWLRRNVEYLTETRKIKMPALIIAKYALLNRLKAKISIARAKARAASFDLFQRDARKKLDFDNGFEFREDMYDGELSFYQGAYKFSKHYLGPNKVPAFDGAPNGEEFQCAKAIDSCPEVKIWLRNIARHPASFHLPISTGNFYPDFIAKLEDDRLLIVEYKGTHIIANPDTKQKAFIGEIWEKEMNGKGLFMVATIAKDKPDLQTQIKTKIGG